TLRKEKGSYVEPTFSDLKEYFFKIILFLAKKYNLSIFIQFYLHKNKTKEKGDDKQNQADNEKVEEEKVEFRKKYPFDLVGRGVAGVDEMREYLDDTKVYFGLLQIKVGTGSFARSKNIFIHFNGDKHPKPLQRSQANKKLKAAKDMMSPWHAELVLANKKECTIDEIFSRTKNAFVADNLGSEGGKLDLTKVWIICLFLFFLQFPNH
ncbi:actin binding protein, partial [Reticulomyxa filosa]